MFGRFRRAAASSLRFPRAPIAMFGGSAGVLFAAIAPSKATFKPAVECVGCPKCEREECMCMDGMKEWIKDDDAYYKGHDGIKHYWPQASKNEKPRDSPRS